MRSAYVICALLSASTIGTLVLGVENDTAQMIPGIQISKNVDTTNMKTTAEPLNTSMSDIAPSNVTITTSKTDPTPPSTTPSTTPIPTTPIPTNSTTTSSTTTSTTTSKPTSSTTSSPASTSSTTMSTSTTTTASKTTAVPPTTVPPSSKDRQFDGLSFFGGIILTTCLMAIAAFSWKFYRQCREGNYRTL